MTIQHKVQSVIAVVFLLLGMPVNAMHLIVTAEHPYDINIEYHVYHNEQGYYSEMRDTIQGLESVALESWVNLFNDSVSLQDPEDSAQGEASRVTFGYRHGDQDIYPGSCSNIPLKEFNVITLTDSGCRVVG